jgi:Cu(I)/Ag(I) efflux system membrane protein CusA/SilA
MENRPRLDPLGWLIRFCLENQLIVFLLLLGIVGGGILVGPFDWDADWLPTGCPATRFR